MDWGFEIGGNGVQVNANVTGTPDVEEVTLNRADWGQDLMQHKVKLLT